MPSDGKGFSRTKNIYYTSPHETLAKISARTIGAKRLARYQAQVSSIRLLFSRWLRQEYEDMT